MDADRLIEEIAEQVKQVDGLRALVLGGSRARGTHTPSSDIDLGFYYHTGRTLDLRALGQIASRLDDERRADLVTPLGGWGPWINGGGWLTVQETAVDFLYRDLQRVNDLTQECLAGQVQIYYQPGHPFGFLTSTYMAELAVCKVLWDPFGDIARLKTVVHAVPGRAAENADREIPLGDRFRAVYRAQEHQPGGRDLRGGVLLPGGDPVSCRCFSRSTASTG